MGVDSEVTVPDAFCLSVLGCLIRIRFQGAEAKGLVETNYLLTHDHQGPVDLEYVVGKRRGVTAFFLQRGREVPRTAADASALLYLFEEDLTLELQRFRRGLYFLHAAVLEWAGNAYLL